MIKNAQEARELTHNSEFVEGMVNLLLHEVYKAASVGHSSCRQTVLTFSEDSIASALVDLGFSVNFREHVLTIYW